MRAARGRAFVGAVTVAILVAGCATVNYGYDEVDNAQMGAYQKFAYPPKKPILVAEPLRVPEPFRVRLLAEATRVLEAKGYSLVDDITTADFVLSFAIGRRDSMRVAAFPEHNRASDIFDPIDMTFDGSDIREMERGRFGIDIFDVGTRQPVWHGWAINTVTSASGDVAEVTIDSVEELLAPFPERQR